MLCCAVLYQISPISHHFNAQRSSIDCISHTFHTEFIHSCGFGIFVLIFSGCGVWTQSNDFFNRQFTPEMNGESGVVEVKSPAIEGFIRFWTFIIILQVSLTVKSLRQLLILIVGATGSTILVSQELRWWGLLFWSTTWKSPMPWVMYLCRHLPGTGHYSCRWKKSSC